MQRQPAFCYISSLMNRLSNPKLLIHSQQLCCEEPHLILALSHKKDELILVIYLERQRLILDLLSSHLRNDPLCKVSCSYESYCASQRNGLQYLHALQDQEKLLHLNQ